MPRTLPLLAAFGALLLACGCIPYSTGTTAATLPPGRTEPATAIYFVPGGMESLMADSSGGALIGVDVEARMGLNDRSDLGIRLPGVVGVVLDYKRRMTGLEDRTGPGLALLAGAGVVNGGEHAIAMGGFVASGRMDRATPYGGFKVMQVFPLTEEAVEDDPTAGFFAGLRIGTEALGVSPEVAVFYDRSALGLRNNDVIVVPSFTVHGNALLEALLGRRPPPYPRPPRGPWR